MVVGGNVAGVSAEIKCPNCDETEELLGTPITDADDVPTGIEIRCERCETTWTRDDELRCPRCNGTDHYPAPVAVLEKSRGTQLSIVSTRSVMLCWACDRDLIDGQRQSGTALMPDELPTS